MDVTTETLQAFLDDAWDAAAPAANSLRETLRKFESAATALYGAGSVASVSKNSASQAYRGPGLGSYTTVQIGNAWRSLITLHDQVKRQVDGGLLDVLPAPAELHLPEGDKDFSVYCHMMGRLVVVTEYQTDITELLLPPTLAPSVLSQ